MPMADMFKMDLSNHKRLRKLYKRAPVAARRAVAFTVTGLAFGTRRESQEVIKSKFTLRNAKFILGSIITVIARGNVPINKITAITGSVHRPRYTGLEEQQTGKTSTRNRVFTSAAREGDNSNVTKGWARLKPNAKYPSPSNASGIKGGARGQRDFSLQGLSGAPRIVAFLSILAESKRAQTFIIKRRFGRFKRGLYRFAQGTIRKLQSFDTKRRPKRVPWLTLGRKKYLASINLDMIWKRNILKELKKLR
jgi:hypothetical protein